jgi:hypothetical protein
LRAGPATEFGPREACSVSRIGPGDHGTTIFDKEHPCTLQVDRGLQPPLASEITPQAVYKARRQWMQGLAAVAAGLVLPVSPAMAQSARPGKLPLPGGRSAVAGA